MKKVCKMNNSDLIETYAGFFASELSEDTLWLKFSGNFFHNIISFDQQNFISDHFERISPARETRSIVLH